MVSLQDIRHSKTDGSVKTLLEVLTTTNAQVQNFQVALHAVQETFGGGNRLQEMLPISFGGIPNSSSLMPCLTTWAHSCSAMVLPMRTMSSPKGVQKQSHGCSCQGCKVTNHTLRNPPEPSRTLRKLHPEPASGTCLRNLHQHTPEPSETLGTCLRNLHQHTSESSGTFRNLPPELTQPSEPTPAHTGTLRNLPPEPTPAHAGTLRNLPEPASGNYTSTPEPSGTCLRNLHQHTPEPCGTFRNLPPEPAPATRTGTHRSLSGLKTPLAYAVGEKKSFGDVWNVGLTWGFKKL